MKHYVLPVSPATVHWGYFSKAVTPSLTLRSGDRATIETLTHHANDDYERMIAGDPGAESVFHWTREHKAISRRGAGPADGPFTLGSGEGVGVHLLTGPVVIEGAEPGDVLEVRILDVRPRPSCNACHAGRCFGSNVAASWGFQYHDLIEEPKPREVVTIFELDGQDLHAVAHWGAIPQDIGTRFPCSRGHVAGRTVLERKPIHVRDLQAEAEEFPGGSAFAKRFGR